jgi:hypothetical protein
MEPDPAAMGRTILSAEHGGGGGYNGKLSTHNFWQKSMLMDGKSLFFLAKSLIYVFDRLCGLVVRVSGYRSRGPGFDSRRFQIFWEAVGLERGPLSTREYNWGATWNSSGFGQENREYDRGDTLPWPRNTLYPQTLVLLRQEAAVARSA